MQRNDHDSEQKAVQDYKKAVHAALRNKASIFIVSITERL